jgi:integrase/recombinase XerD
MNEHEPVAGPKPPSSIKELINGHMLKNFEDALRVSGKKHATIASYLSDVKAFFAYLELSGYQAKEVNHDAIAAYLKSLQHESAVKQNSLRRKTIAIKQFFRLVSYHSDETALLRKETIADRTPIPKRLESPLTPWSADNVAALLNATNQSFSLKALRDKLLLCLLAYEGLKVSEVIGLQWSDFLVGKNMATLRVGGERARVLTLSAASTQAMAAYKDILLQHVHLTGYPFILVGFHGKVQTRVTTKLTRHGVKFVLYELASVAGLERLHAEDLRHYAIQTWLEKGLAPELIMQYLGLRRLGNITKHRAQKGLHKS